MPAGRLSARCCALPFTAGAFDRREKCALARRAPFAAVARQIDDSGLAPAPFDIRRKGSERDGPIRIGGLRCHILQRFRA